MHRQIRGNVEQLNAAVGRTFDATNERMAASLLTPANDNGCPRSGTYCLTKGLRM